MSFDVKSPGALCSGPMSRLLEDRAVPISCLSKVTGASGCALLIAGLLAKSSPKTRQEEMVEAISRCEPVLAAELVNFPTRKEVQCLWTRSYLLRCR